MTCAPNPWNGTRGVTRRLSLTSSLISTKTNNLDLVICRYELEYEDGEREAAVAQSAILSIGFGCFSDEIADNDDLAPTTAKAKNWAMTHPPPV